MAQKSNIQVSFGIDGMNRETFHHNLDEKGYTFMLNGNIESDTSTIALTNEHSNFLCSKLKPGYVVIGTKYDSLNSKVWFLLTEKYSHEIIDEEGNLKDVRNSEIGYIKISTVSPELSDGTVECGCDMASILSEPLENLTQTVEHCSYTTLISDECNNCLNFDPNYPAKNIVLKQEACGFTMTFATKNNPLRYIILDKIDYYKQLGTINCGVDDTVPTCLDCDKLRVFSLYDRPYIHPEVISYGGNLKRGSYEFYMAYCDKLGNELTPYIAATNPIHIFDTDNIELDQTSRFDKTMHSIRLKMFDLDPKFNFYKINVVENTDVSGAQSVFVEGIHSITDTNVTYSSNGSNNGDRFDLESLFVDKPIYKNFGGILQSNGYLMGYDYEVEKEWNLQPMVNLLGTFVKWQTVEADETLYKDGINTSNFKGYMRDETYPLGISFGTNQGYKTSVFPFIARPPKASDLVEYSTGSNMDVTSLLENTPVCTTSERKYHWQYYNTGKYLGESYSTTPNSGVVIPIDVTIKESCVQEGVKSLMNGSITINIEDDFYNIKDWVFTHHDEICDPTSEFYNAQLCNLITDTVTTPCDTSDIFPFPICDGSPACVSQYCDTLSPDYNASICENIQNGIGMCGQPVLSIDPPKLYIGQVTGEEIIPKPKRYPWIPDNGIPTYDHSPTGKCQQFLANTMQTLSLRYFSRDGTDYRTDFEVKNFINRTELYGNNTCANSMLIGMEGNFFTTNYTLMGVTQFRVGDSGPFTTIPHYIKDKNTTSDVEAYTTLDKSTILTTVSAIPKPGFEDFIHTDALWYEIDFTQQDEVLLEITPTVYIKEDISTLVNDDVRFSVYNKCTNPTALFADVYKSDQGYWKLLKKSDFGNLSKVYVCLDTKLKNFSGFYTFEATGDDYRFSYQGITTSSIPGCFTIKARPIEYYEVQVNFSTITIDKETIYESVCKYNKPLDNDCGANADKYGMFSYWESIEEYPDNADLYDSSNFKIKRATLNHEDIELRNLFESYYVEALDSTGNFIWKEQNGKKLTNFVCEPIRHFKFPDNNVVPFMTTTPLTEFSKSRIFPIGITIDERTIEAFLDAAVESGLLTKEERKSINSYQIYRGDRVNNRSIIYKGILNDMYEDPYQSNAKQRTFFRNFPYNTLGKNAFLSETSERTTLIKHPYGSTQNDRFSLISPDVYINRVRIPSEMTIDGYMYGNAVSKFSEVKGHSEWVLLGEEAYKKAGKLATAEVVLEAALNIATMTIEASKGLWFMIGFANGTGAAGSIAGYIAAGIYVVAEVINAALFKQPKYKTQWLDIFDARGNVENFASMQISSKGQYNFFKPNSLKGDMHRGLIAGRYLNNGLEALSEREGNTVRTIVINNKDRENSVYLSTGSQYPISYPSDYIKYDNYDISPKNSSRYISSDDACKTDGESLRRIASAYASLKNYTPDQYGKIDEIKWLSINHNPNFRNESKLIFGGDIYISRVDLKNKFPMFNKNAIDIANRTPFKYSKASNVGYTRFYADHKSSRIEIGANDIPYMSSQYHMDCKNNSKVFYENHPSKFYLFSYGIPYFLIESEINSNYRYAGVEPHEQFASRGINIDEWVQEKNVSIAHNNIFYYNNVYSQNQKGILYRKLPAYYDREKFDCISDVENGIAWSEQDNSEISLSDPWLVFRPMDVYRFPFSHGKLISMDALESAQVLGRFANNATVFNSIDIIKERVTTELQRNQGTGGIFAQRPMQFSYTELGETGSQHRSMVSCEFGHFWVDAKRGKIFQMLAGGKDMPKLNTISDFKQKGKESGMRKWFKRHLPFKILTQNITNLTEEDIDNTYKSIGILMWWDSKFKRVFITKKDYVVKAPYKNKIVFSAGNYNYVDGEMNIPVELTNTQYFKDVSWTIAFSPIYENWISYYDYKPDYAIAYNDYFQTGKNYSPDTKEIGLWSHLLTNKSYQVFYGKKYPWTIEVPIKNTYTNNVLQDLKIWAVSHRYHDNFDYAAWRKKSFNKLTIYNQTNNSGLLHLNYDDSMNKSKYPISISQTEQGIQATNFEEQIWVNYFYNRVRREESHLPVWNSDDNEINKQLNTAAISFNSKRVLERLRGEWFLVRLTADEDTRFKQYFKWMVSIQEPYQ